MKFFKEYLNEKKMKLSIGSTYYIPEDFDVVDNKGKKITIDNGTEFTVVDITSYHVEIEIENIRYYIDSTTLTALKPEEI